MNKTNLPNRHPINIEQKLSLFNDHWNPRIVGELNKQHVKIAKLKVNLFGISMMMKMKCF